MTASEKNDLFYVCSLIEFIARETKNRRKVVVESIGEQGLHKLLKDASVNHCLSFEQVCEEVVSCYRIPTGNFETVLNCKYSVPRYTDIGKLYSIIILNENYDAVSGMVRVFSSSVCDLISNFNSDLYYQNPSYLAECINASELLAG